MVVRPREVLIIVGVIHLNQGVGLWCESHLGRRDGFVTSILAVAISLLIRNVEFIGVLFLTHLSRRSIIVDVVTRRTQLGLALLYCIIVLLEPSMDCLARTVIVRIL